jgi:hypothetical protein
VVALRSDVEAKQAASALKRKFMTHAEALLHGDLHTLCQVRRCQARSDALVLPLNYPLFIHTGEGPAPAKDHSHTPPAECTPTHPLQAASWSRRTARC